MRKGEVSGFYVDRSGERYVLDDLLDEVPSFIFLGALHVSVCQKISKAQYYCDDFHKVFTNLLVAHSVKAKLITALITLVRNGDVKLLKIESDYITEELLEGYIETAGINFTSISINSVSFLGKGVVKKLLFKWALHRTYRLFFNVRSPSSVMIRSWVEITKKMYGEHYAQSLILIYPFVLNASRHKKYIQNCFKEYKRASLCGLPYSLKDWLKMLFSAEGTDRGYVRFEHNAYQKHGHELLKKGVRTLYTSDEFEAAAFVMAEVIREHDGHVVNTAHGLSFGAPYTSYDCFSVYNEAQKKYYQKFSRNTKFEVLPRINAGEADLLGFDGVKGYAIVYLEANFERLNMRFETKLEAASVQALRDVGNSLGIKVFVKAHPNRKCSEYETFSQNAGVGIIRHLQEIKDYKPIFVTIVSAAYYDYRQFGPFVFVDEGYGDLEDFYGESVNKYPVELLGQAIEACISRGLSKE